MAKQLTQNGMSILDYVKGHDAQCTAEDIANALGLTKAQVNGSITGSFYMNKVATGEVDENGKAVKVHTPLMERVAATDPEGNTVKVIRLTDAGKSTEYELKA